jgi:hypothetical protein
VIRSLLAVVLCAAAARADAASIDDLTVTEAAGRYLIEVRAHLGVRAGDAFAVFADLGNLRSINSDVREATILGRAGNGRVELYTVFRACVLWYCRSIHETQEMTFARGAAGGEVDAVVLPGTGDFRSGHARWLFRAAGGGTDLEATAELEPTFRVPPLIGPWLVRRWLRSETERAVANIETLARSPVTSSPPRTAR